MTSLTDGPARQEPRRVGARGDCEHCATRSVCVLAPLDLNQLRQMQSSIREHTFRKGEVLVEEHARTDSIHVIKVGSVFGVRRGLDDEVRPVGLWGRGTAFGMASFFGEQNQLTGVAATAGRACAIQIAGLAAEARRNPALDAQIRATMARAFGNVAAWAEAVRLPGVTRQLAYAMLLLSRAERSTTIELPDQKSLAALLGTSRESIARAMALLEHDGIVQRRGRRLCEVARDGVLALLAPQASAWPPLADPDSPPEGATQDLSAPR